MLHIVQIDNNNHSLAEYMGGAAKKIKKIKKRAHALFLFKIYLNQFN